MAWGSCAWVPASGNLCRLEAVTVTRLSGGVRCEDARSAGNEAELVAGALQRPVCAG